MLAVSRYCDELGRCLRPGLFFLFTLAWRCRNRLPIILTVGFLIMDVRMRLEINFLGADDDVDIETDEEDEEEEEDDDDNDDEWSDCTNEEDDSDEVASYQSADQSS